jgi:hypothetical protein
MIVIGGTVIAQTLVAVTAAIVLSVPIEIAIRGVVKGFGLLAAAYLLYIAGMRSLRALP